MGASRRAGRAPRLSRFYRAYARPDGLAVLEALLPSQSLWLDAALGSLVRALAAGSDRPVRDATAAGHSREDVEAQLDALERVGLIVPSQSRDERAWAEAFERSIPTAPLIDQIELTNHCPMSCVMCVRATRGPGRPCGFLDPAVFDRLVGWIADHGPMPKPLTLHSWGESLLHPALVPMVRRAARAGIATELSVNPGLLGAPRYRALRDAGLSRLVLSLDGVTPGTLEAVRGRSARGKQALANVSAVLKERRRTGEAAPQLVIQMIRLAANEPEHAAFLQRYGDLGLPGVLAFLKPPDATTDARLFPAGLAGQQELCRAPWQSLVVLWDGRGTTCCHDCDGRNVVGDLRTHTIDEIWNGRRLRALRRRLIEGRTTSRDACNGCAHRPDRYRPPSLDGLPVDPLAW